MRGVTTTKAGGHRILGEFVPFRVLIEARAGPWLIEIDRSIYANCSLRGALQPGRRRINQDETLQAREGGPETLEAVTEFVAGILTPGETMALRIPA